MSTFGAAGFRDPALLTALDRAIAGDTADLYARLGRLSGLPGVRVNAALVEAFAVEVGGRGRSADALLRAMVTLDADAAPGGSPLEIVPVCGVHALAARAVDPKGRARAVALLHAAADDLRFRVRDAVPEALARIGAGGGDALVADLAPFMDGYFHAAAALRALATPALLDATRDGAGVAARLREAFDLAREAPRSASRYPGFKALVDALTLAPSRLARRYPAEIVAEVERWAGAKDPALRDVARAVAKTLRERHGEDAARIKDTLERTAPPPRDPTRLIKGMRGRGKKRGG